MSSVAIQTKSVVNRPRISEVLDQAWLDEGMSLQELETNNQIADIFDQLLAYGRTAEDINVEWATQTSEQIFCRYAALVPELTPNDVEQCKEVTEIGDRLVEAGYPQDALYILWKEQIRDSEDGNAIISMMARLYKGIDRMYTHLLAIAEILMEPDAPTLAMILHRLPAK